MHCSSSSYLPKTIHNFYRLRQYFIFENTYWRRDYFSNILYPGQNITEWKELDNIGASGHSAEKSSAKTLRFKIARQKDMCPLAQQPLRRREFLRFPWRGYDLVWCRLHSARGIERCQSAESPKVSHVMWLLLADALAQTLCRTRKLPHLTVCIKCRSQLACDHLTFDSTTKQTITQLQIFTYVTQEYLPAVVTSCCKVITSTRVVC